MARSEFDVAPKLGYQPGFDGIRALGAIVIVLFHAQLGFSNGTVGVDIFFVLSGFLITSLLLSEHQRSRGLDFRRFYRRRALRLLPAYFATVIVCVAISVIWSVAGTLRGAVFSLFYVSNWAEALGSKGLGLLDHTWSLSIEEQFYLLCPLGLVLLFKLSPHRYLPRVLVFGVLFVLGTAEAIFLAARGHDNYVYAATETRAPALLAGCITAMFVFEAQKRGTLLPDIGRRFRWVGLPALVALILIAAVHPGSTFVMVSAIRPSVEVLSILVILGALYPAGLLRKALANQPAVAVGKVSYGVYLWNFPIFFLLDRHFGLRGNPGIAIVGLIITAIVCTLSYRFIELPFLRIKAQEARQPRHLEPTPEPAASAVG
jgi:peptidoglycan/LPS O-acetylase OafA/YrhL